MQAAKVKSEGLDKEMSEDGSSLEKLRVF